MDRLVAQTVLAKEDFDYRVRQYFHAVHSLGGQDGLNEACLALEDVLHEKRREEIDHWPAYLCTLLREQLDYMKGGNAQAKPRSPRKPKKKGATTQMGQILRLSLLLGLALLCLHCVIAFAPTGFMEMLVICGLVCGYFMEERCRTLCTWFAKGVRFT